MTMHCEKRVAEFIGILIVFVFLSGCEKRSVDEKQPMPATNNAQILQEADAGKLWFHARKTKPIWVRLLEREEKVKTLEGDELVPAGNYLCRGEAGDIWPQTPQRLTDKYDLTDEVDDQGWRKCTPKTDAAGVMAAQIPHQFQVHAKWGLLSGKAGDYLVKSYEDRDNADPQDVWIVDQQLFTDTYQRVEH